jgi:hypothetical protein
MRDITYCVIMCCPFTDCERHPNELYKIEKGKYVSIADFGGVCRRYLEYLLEELEKGGE